jgi:MFS transporter, AAHS family, 4-hydroxybenzoate transporter
VEQIVRVSDVIEAQKSSWFQRSLIFWIAVTMMIEGNDNQVVGFAAPVMIRELHIDSASFGPVFGVGLFGYMLGALALSAIGDRFGRRRLVIAGALLFGGFTVATAYVTTLASILPIRFCAGIGLGCAIPNSVALMAEYAPARTRATRISLMFVGYTVGSALGGLAAAWLVPRYGWTSVFQLGGWSGIGLAAALYFTLPESVRFLAVTHSRQAELAATLKRLDPALEIGPQTRFVADELAQPGVPVKYLFLEGRAAKTILLWIAYIATQITLQFMTSWLPTVIHRNGISLADAEITIALLQAGGALGSIAFGWMLDRLGVHAVAAGFIVAVPVVVGIGLTGGIVPLLMALATAAGFCIAGGQSGINALGGTIYPTFMRATGSGWAFGIGRTGSILGPVIGGYLLGLSLTTPQLFAFVAAPALCAAGALFLLGYVAGRFPQDSEGGTPVIRVDRH